MILVILSMLDSPSGVGAIGAVAAVGAPPLLKTLLKALAKERKDGPPPRQLAAVHSSSSAIAETDPILSTLALVDGACLPLWEPFFVS